MTKDLNILAAEVHAAAKEKGFWDAPNNGEKLMLIVSELSEALEAHRNGKFADLVAYEAAAATLGGFVPLNFKDYIKDTFEDELADVVIRVLDFCGGNGLELRPITESYAIGTDLDSVRAANVGSVLLGVTASIMGSLRYRKDDGWWAYEVVQTIFHWTNALGIDLWKHIELKLKYNASRPHKHGKAY